MKKKYLYIVLLCIATMLFVLCRRKKDDDKKLQQTLYGQIDSVNETELLIKSKNRVKLTGTVKIPAENFVIFDIKNMRQCMYNDLKPEDNIYVYIDSINENDIVYADVVCVGYDSLGEVPAYVSVKAIGIDKEKNYNINVKEQLAQYKIDKDAKIRYFKDDKEANFEDIKISSKLLLFDQYEKKITNVVILE